MLVGEMDPAVAQFPVVKADLFGIFLSLFAYHADSLAFFFVFNDLAKQYICRLGIPVQVIVQLFLNEIAYETSESRASRAHFPGIEDRFCLIRKFGFNKPYADGPDYGLPDVGRFEILFEKFLNGPRHCFSENGQMGSSL